MGEAGSPQGARQRAALAWRPMLAMATRRSVGEPEMKILAQIAPLTALLGLTLSGVACVGSPVDDASDVQADDPSQAPPWQGGQSAPPPSPSSMGGVVGV